MSNSLGLSQVSGLGSQLLPPIQLEEPVKPMSSRRTASVHLQHSIIAPMTRLRLRSHTISYDPFHYKKGACFETEPQIKESEQPEPDLLAFDQQANDVVPSPTCCIRRQKSYNWASLKHSTKSAPDLRSHRVRPRREPPYQPRTPVSKQMDPITTRFHALYPAFPPP